MEKIVESQAKPAEKIGILDISLYHYRHPEDSLCSRYTPDLEETFAAVGREVQGIYKGRAGAVVT